MPGFDRTGPAGGGPRTGWGRGQCGQRTGTRGLSWSSSFKGGGRGRCFGGGGWRFPFGRSSLARPTDEAGALKADISATKEELAAMEARLSELEKKE
ncbi:MAG: DUF5320 domain-containing protein [Desulfomonile tiedjei]|nr:DUF5320 domain-containing protein [Desulfomonile tiedjei]